MARCPSPTASTTAKPESLGARWGDFPLVFPARSGKDKNMARTKKTPAPLAYTFKDKEQDPFLYPFETTQEAGLAEDGESQKPCYYNPELRSKLFKGDALELLKKCRGGIFDLVFADPPYFLSNGGITCQGGKMVKVDKGKWDESQSFENDHEFNMTWIRECYRVLKPNGTIFISGTAHNIYSVGFALQSLGYKIINDIAWFKVNPPPNLACRYFTHSTETILWAKKGEKAKHTFNYEIMKAMPDPAPNKQMLSLWKILPPGTQEKRYGKHPTQKPEALLERIVLAASNPGDLVLDPFCGSGTTGVAAVRHGRSFIGFDLEEKYLDLAVKRIEDEKGLIAINPRIQKVA
jgi:site-specific DNA-methyltransferase (adenine-specific)